MNAMNRTRLALLLVLAGAAGFGLAASGLVGVYGRPATAGVVPTGPAPAASSALAAAAPVTLEATEPAPRVSSPVLLGPPAVVAARTAASQPPVRIAPRVANSSTVLYPVADPRVRNGVAQRAPGGMTAEVQALLMQKQQRMDEHNLAFGGRLEGQSKPLPNAQAQAKMEMLAGRLKRGAPTTKVVPAPTSASGSAAPLGQLPSPK